MRWMTLIAAGVFALSPASARLTGYKVLPADTFAAGPPSGVFLKSGVRAPQPPFPSQPVQGFSSIWPAGDGWWWALVDNGYGTRLNSPDFMLRIYRIAPHFDDGSKVEVDSAFVQLRDPQHLVPFHIVHDETSERLLTGADFDPESMVRLQDGSFWIGEEFGPFLLHVAADGIVLEPPVEAPGIRSPDNPFVLPPDAGKSSDATVARSRGFEGLALEPTGRLIALLEGGTVGDAGRQSRALEFDPRTHAFTGREWRIPFESAAHSFTEIVHYEGDRYLLIERDNLQGAAARFKRVFIAALTPDREGPAYVEKRLFVDLLAIDDPGHIGGTSGTFTFPFITTEAVWPVDLHTLVLVNDNNYPGTGGRTPDKKDNDEFIRLRIE